MRLRVLRTANITRDRESLGKRIGRWTGTDWATLLAGEIGKLVSKIAKLRRGKQVQPQALSDKMADVLTCLDLLAAHYGIDLAEALRSKWNLVSLRVGSHLRLSPEGDLVSVCGDVKEQVKGELSDSGGPVEKIPQQRCPLCGSPAASIPDLNRGWRVSCMADDCGLTGPIRIAVENAELEWQRIFETLGQKGTTNGQVQEETGRGRCVPDDGRADARQ